MKKLFLSAILISGFSFFIASCHCKKKTTATTTTQSTSTTPTDADIQKIQEQQKAYANEGYSRGMVINYEVDGCTYLIQLGDGTKLQPTSLKDEFKKDKLDVWIKYAAKKGAVSNCMSGQIVDITDIQLRK